MDKSVVLWMHEDFGGAEVRRELTTRFRAAGWSVVEQPNLRRCVIEDGTVLADDGVCLTDSFALYHMWEDGLTPYVMDVLRHCERGGVVVSNPTHSFDGCRDKLVASQRLRAAGVNVPASIYTREFEALAAFLERAGEIVLKPRVGHSGAGVFVVRELNYLFDLWAVLRDANGAVLAERRVPFDDGDYRVEFCGGEVVGGYRRMLHHHPFKTNVGSGGRVLEATIPAEMIETARRAVSALGLDFSIVDMVRDRETGDVVVLEVNHLAGVFRETAVRHIAETCPYANQEVGPEDSFDTSKMEALVAFFERRWESAHREVA